LPDYDYLNPREEETPPWAEPPQSVDEKIASVHIEHFKERHDALLRQYIVALSPELSKETALIPPMVLKVDESKWRSPRNQGPPRTQSTAKQNATINHVTKMLEANVVAPSQAPYYSQVLLTGKQDPVTGLKSMADTRLCVDYRPLNEISESMGWPIPNTQQLLQRLGYKKPKYFAVLDLTSGYWQAPLDIKSRWLTAFICVMGIFEYLRVAMGLKGAPSYFQGTMATTVLVGLLYTACELYIDDVCVFGATEDEYFANLESVLQRFIKHKMTFKPSKMKLGLTRVEYVGHVIDRAL
jgi:hypothetical protein